MSQLDRDFRYVNRRKFMQQKRDYLKEMVHKLNSDSWFIKTGVTFSAHSNNYHFVDRFGDRGLEITEVLPKLYQFILSKRCEIIYYSKLVEQPTRLDFNIDGVTIGLSGRAGRLSFRTVFKDYEGRHNGKNCFLIQKGLHYYEQV